MQKKSFGYFWMNDASVENSRQHRNPKMKSHLAGELPTHFLKIDFQKVFPKTYPHYGGIKDMQTKQEASKKF